MKKPFLILFLLLACLPSFAQTQGTTAYPGALDSSTTLLEAKNNTQSPLSGSISSTATTLTLVSATNFPTNGAVSVDSEIIYYAAKSGNDLTGLLRAQEGTTAATHTSGRVVRVSITAAYHNAMRAAIVALQTKLGIGDSTPSAGKVLGYTEGIGSTWVLATGIPGISVDTGSDPNALKTNTTSPQIALGSIDADKPTKTAAQIGALTAGRTGREIYQTDSLLGFKRDFGASVGIRHAQPFYNAYELGIKPNDSDSAVRTANSAAWAAFVTALSSRGGRIVFPEEAFYFADDLEVSKLLIIEGAATAFNDGAVGTRIYVESGQNGLTFVSGAKGSQVKNLSLMTRSGYSGTSTGDGIYSDVTIHVNNVFTSGFGRDGYFLNGTAPSNTDFSSIRDCHAYQNKRDGFHLDGAGDTNVVTLSNNNSFQNGRHGFYNAGASNTFIGLHANENAQVTGGSYDYYDNGSTSFYSLPYSEGSASAIFYLAGSSVYNTIICGIYGVPEFDNTAPGLNGGHLILDRGYFRALRLKDKADASPGTDFDFFSEGQHLYLQAVGVENLLDYNAVTTETTLTKLAYSGTLRASGTPQSLSGAGAVNLTTDTTLWTTTAADAATLADGTAGQTKKIIMLVDGGDGTLTPTNRLGYSTITFTAIGQSVTLQFLDSKWVIIAWYGVTIA